MINFPLKIFLFHFILFATILFRIKAFSQEFDTTSGRYNWEFKNLAKKSVVPCVLIGYGASVIGDNGLFYSSEDVYNDIQRNYAGFHTEMDDYLFWAPAAAVYGLNLAGVKGKHDFVNRTLIYLISETVSGLIVSNLKGSTEILRPDSSNNRSFPSGHTSAAFVSATFMYEEYKEKSILFGVAGYAMATATGVLRMFNNKHWMADVFVGAGIGILVTEATYFVYPWIQDKVSKDGTSNLVLLPTYQNKSVGITLVYQPHH